MIEEVLFAFLENFQKKFLVCRLPKKPEKYYLSFETYDHHLLKSQWLGEAHVFLSPLLDGNVSNNWYKLARSLNTAHQREPSGYIHLALHVSDSPAFDKDLEELTLEEWRNKGKLKDVRLDMSTDDTNDFSPIMARLESQNQLISNNHK